MLSGQDQDRCYYFQEEQEQAEGPTARQVAKAQESLTGRGSRQRGGGIVGAVQL